MRTKGCHEVGNRWLLSFEADRETEVNLCLISLDGVGKFFFLSDRRTILPGTKSNDATDKDKQGKQNTKDRAGKAPPGPTKRAATSWPI